MNEEGAVDMAGCLEQVRQGDEAAARVLMDHLYPLVLKIVRAHRPSRTSEEDLVQTVFMKVFTNLRQFSGKVPVEHWVSRIAVNSCYNALKAEKIRPEVSWAELSEQEQMVLESLSQSAEDAHPSHGLAAREILDKLLVRLSPEDRLLIQWLHLDEKSVAEISRLTGWTMTSVKVKAFRVRRRLQKYLKELLKEEGK